MGLALYRQHAFDRLWQQHGERLYSRVPEAEWGAAVYHDSLGQDLMHEVYRLDWAHILTPRVTADALLTPDKARDLLAFVLSLQPPRAHYWHEKRAWLISFLRGAIDANDPIDCSW